MVLLAALRACYVCLVAIDTVCWVVVVLGCLRLVVFAALVFVICYVCDCMLSACLLAIVV